MLMLLTYLPQEPSDPVYGRLMSGSAAYEWEAQSQYRASHACALASASVVMLTTQSILHMYLSISW